MSEQVQRLNSIDALYHAAGRYERDPMIRATCANPDWVAQSLRDSAKRIEEMHAARSARLK